MGAFEVLKILSAIFSETSNQNAYVYAHNFVVNRKTEQIEGFATREWNPKDGVLAEIVKNRYALEFDFLPNNGRRLSDSEFEKQWQATGNRLVNDLNAAATGNEFNFARPAPETDILALPVGKRRLTKCPRVTELLGGGNVVVVPHPNQERIVPAVHLGPVGAMISLRRPAAPSEAEQNKPEETAVNGSPTKKTETTGAADESSWQNLNAQLRDRFAAENHLRALDAGFDSVIASIAGNRIDSWIFVRGISDYQQGASRSGRQWQVCA